MNNLLRIFLLALLINLSVTGLSMAQRKADADKTRDAVPQKYVLSPDDIEKRKSVAPKTYTTVQHEEADVPVSAADIENRAILLLNTENVPKDFPRYDPSKMNAKIYEGNVAEYFRKNPEKRKRN